MDTTGGYASWLHGKVERQHRFIASKVQAMLNNSGLNHAADAYRLSFHSAIQMTPYETWYGIKPSIHHFRVWGYVVYVGVPKDDRVIRGYFLGFTKSRLIIHWLDPTTNTVKHASAFRFDEFHIKRTEDDKSYLWCSHSSYSYASW